MRTAIVLLLLAATGCAARNKNGGATPRAAVPAADEIAALDTLLAAHWQKAGVTPAPAAADGEYLRRVTLDLAGRLPTLGEARAYLADAGADKQARLVDRLLASPDYGVHFATLEADVLFGPNLDRRLERADPRGYLAAAFDGNRRYDVLARELVTASGSVGENGAAAFLVARARGGGGPEAAAGAVARVFLGLSIQCAQCHDHPYDTRWKQTDFYGLVGYFARTRARREKPTGNAMPVLAQQSAGDAMVDADGVPASGMTTAAMPMDKQSYALSDARRGEARMHAPGATEDVVVKPRFLGREIAAFAGEPRRVTFARALIESDLFAKAFVGRVWTRLFGAGLVDPWDDLGAEHDPRHPPLLTTLAADFRASGFDVKRLMRRLVLSAAYTRSSAPPASDDGGAAVRAFARARVRPLHPEQLFRALITATGADAMARTRGGKAANDPEALEARLQRQAERALREYRFTFEDDEMADADYDGTLPQALLLFNGELTNAATRAGTGGVLGEILLARREPEVRLEDMFLAVYTRLPTPDERALFAPALANRNDRRAYEDAFFALAVSTEAITNH